MTTRYIVKRETSVIGVFFQVYDGWQGIKVGAPQMFKDDAERIARRMEVQSNEQH